MGLPEDPGVRQELYHGELITMPPAKWKHFSIQRRLRMLLEPLAEAGSVVDKEMGYRPLPEHEVWIADVAYLCASRTLEVDPNGNVQGAPELVIEVLSPSNRAAEMYDKEQICLANGAKEFWVVDPKRRNVRVAVQDGRTATYLIGDRIPLSVLGSEALLSVEAVFSSLD